MNDNDKLLRIEEEEFIEQLSSLFKAEREKKMIGDAVAKKIGSSDFSLPPLIKNGGGFFNFRNVIIIITSAILIIVALLYSTTSNNRSNLEKEQPNRKEKPSPMINNSSDKSNNSDEIQTPVINGKQPPKVPLKNKAVVDNTNSLNAIKGLTPAERIEGNIKLDSVTFVIATDNLSSLEDKITSFLTDRKFNVNKYNDDRFRLYLSTDDMVGYSQNGKKMKYYIDIKINENEPERIYVYLVEKQINPGKMTKKKLTIEKNFRKNIVNREFEQLVQGQ